MTDEEKTVKKNKKSKKEEPVVLKPQPSLLRDSFSTLITMILMIGFVLFFLNFIGRRVLVEGRSMEDTLHDNDQLIVDCFSYHFVRMPDRFDVVVFRLKDKPNIFYVKRIIGLPGETVQITDSKIYINGKVIEDPYATQRIFPSGAAEQPVTLKENEYFVMGDNRNNSLDSRYDVGPVKLSQFIGRAFYRLFPWDSRGAIPASEG